MSHEALVGWAAELQATLVARESQLERKFQEVANMQDVTQQLMVLLPTANQPTGSHTAISCSRCIGSSAALL